MSSVVIDVGLGMLERFGGDVGKMLAVAIGGGLGASAFNYFQSKPFSGFDYSKRSARRTGTAVGRGISVGYDLNGAKTGKSLAQNATSTYRFPKKYRPIQHRRSHRNCGRDCTCGCSQSRSARRY